jgi:DNA repair exonuclease SbcCD ATPase subunit
MPRPKTQTPEQRRLANLAWRKANPEKCREQERRYRERHKERLMLEARDRRVVTRDQRAAMRRKTRYGLTPEDFESRWLAQGGRCPVCGVELARDHKLGNGHAVDHCHTTGKVRGVICRRCNIGLGYFNDTPAFLRAAADYLENSK